jgi:hypothetical protein
MSMPSGDSPQDAQAYYDYLNGHHIIDGRVQTWHVDWLSLAWLWGFIIVLTIAAGLWVRQYRTTRTRAGIYPVDRFGGWATEAAGPATSFFLILTAFLTAFAVVMVISHLIWGQRF